MAYSRVFGDADETSWASRQGQFLQYFGLESDGEKDVATELEHHSNSPLMGANARN